MSVVVIRVDGTDITADVELLTARFNAQVNGAIGTCSFRVRDDGHTYDFVSGGELTLDIDGVRVWGGYLTRASRVYPFAVEDTSGSRVTTAPRFWSMAGVDYNVLFTKRIVFDAAHPTTKLSFDYAVGTYDDTIIHDLFDNYLDLSSDGLDDSGVERVDIVTLDIKGVTSGKGTLTKGRGQVASAGYTWKQAMDVIARATGAIYYIDPNKVFHYVDVDTADASNGLSDQPSGSDIGYQGFNLLYNGTNLVNDMLVWGAAAGADNIVFSRAQSSPSQAAHGLWQGGLFSEGLYHQASADLVSASYINGSPQNKRGGKDDAISLNCKVFEPAFTVGQKVATEVNIFGYSDTLPIRRQEISFINPEQAQFALTLSHDIDQPWSIFESLFQSFQKPHFKFPWTGHKPPVLKPLPTPGGCTDAICGITDTFTRGATNGLGISDSTLPWVTPTVAGGYGWDAGNLAVSVNGTAGVFDLTNADVVNASQVLEGAFDLPATLTMHFTAVNVPLPGIAAWGMDLFPDSNLVNGAYLELFTNPSFSSSGTNNLGIQVNMAPLSTSGSFIEPGAAGSLIGFSGLPFTVKVEVTTTSISAKYWFDSDPEPGAYQVTIAGAVVSPLGRLNWSYNGDQGATGSIALDSLDIAGVDRCSEYRFDNFNRAVDPGWGTASSGPAWAAPLTLPAGAGGDASADVSAGGGELFAYQGTGGGGSVSTVEMVVPLPAVDDAWTMTAKVQVIGRGIFTFDVRKPDNSSSRNFAIDFDPTDGVGPAYRPTFGGGVGFTSTPFDQGPTFYHLKWEFLRGVHDRLRVWADGDVEPTTWLYDVEPGGGTSLGTSQELHVILNHTGLVANSNSYLYIDSINFDYSNKPCFQCPRFDDFNRTVASGWGTSDFGLPWTSSGTWTPSVDGSQAVLLSPGGDTSTSHGMYALDGPWLGDFTMTTVLTMPTTTDGTQPSLDFIVTDTPSSWFAGGYFDCFFSVDQSGGTGTLWIEDGGMFEVVNVVWGPGTYTLVLEKFGSILRAKVWLDGSTEPGWLVTGTLTGSFTQTAFVVDGIRNLSTPLPRQDATFYIDSINFDNGACDPAPAVSSSATEGYTCETATRIDATHYQLPARFVPGSAEVKVNGMLVRRGVTLAYTEDPETGVLIFNDDVTDGSVVTACYQANGAL